MKFLYSIYHFFLAWTGSVFYRHPSRDIFVLGVTGTKGKSTTLALVDAILTKAGKKSALLSSQRRKIGEKEEKTNSNTMPGRWAIQRFLRRAVKAGCEYALIEVTSEGVRQHRHRFVDWDAALFLNLHPEHIEAHGSFEKYRKAKVDFFRYLKKSKKPKKYFFINKGDQSAGYFEKAAENVPGSEVIHFSRGNAFRMAEYLRGQSDADWLKADFNLANIAAAISFAKSQNIDESIIWPALLGFKGLAGRLEFVQHEPFAVVVDYAHTPESLRLVYEHLRKSYLKPGSKMICVFGSAGGGRDKWKRPELGKVAEQYCDEIILTSEDPYAEKPQDIINDIKKGFSETLNSKSETLNVYEIIDRKEALQKAISLAKKGDVVIATGMGSQKWFYGPKGRIPWNEKKILEDAI